MSRGETERDMREFLETAQTLRRVMPNQNREPLELLGDWLIGRDIVTFGDAEDGEEE